MSTFYFELRQTGKHGTNQHLALFADNSPDGAPPLAHWVMPSEMPRRATGSTTALLTEATALLPLPGVLLDAGPALLSATQLPVACSQLQLNLTLQGQLLRGRFCLQRVQPGGQLWLLSPALLPATRQPPAGPALLPPGSGRSRSAVYTQPQFGY